MRKGLTVLIVALLGVFAVKSVMTPGKMSLGELDEIFGADLRSACGAARRHEELPVRRRSASIRAAHTPLAPR